MAPRGFESLHLSLWGAWKVFGSAAEYWVAVNTIAPEDVAERIAPPMPLRWCHSVAPVPWLGAYLDDGMADGVAWKLTPVRVAPGCPELALDNDVVLWALPAAVARWLSEPASFLLAADVSPAFGRFSPLCGRAPRNTGMRGVPAGFDLEAALQRFLDRQGGLLCTELDEQGMQVATLQRAAQVAGAALHVVDTGDVAICSPFPPHSPEPGRSGAHFVGLNTKRLGWRYYDRPAEEVRAEHWDALRAELYRLTGAPPAPCARFFGSPRAAT